MLKIHTETPDYNVETLVDQCLRSGFKDRPVGEENERLQQLLWSAVHAEAARRGQGSIQGILSQYNDGAPFEKHLLKEYFVQKLAEACESAQPVLRQPNRVVELCRWALGNVSSWFRKSGIGQEDEQKKQIL